MPNQFLSLSTDSTLGGNSSSNYIAPSQKAIKEYVDGLRTDWYGTCSTAAATQTKVVTCDGFVLKTGVSIRVKFTYAQTYSGMPNLDVNGTGAIAVQYKDGSDGIRYMWLSGEIVSFTYDGTYWIVEDGGLATTTYYGYTKLSTSSTSTSTSLAATPYAINLAMYHTVTGYPSFLSSATYAVGDRVRYSDGYMYECNTAITTAEGWDATHWTALPTLQEQVDTKVTKDSSSSAKAYGTTSAGVETTWKVSSSASASTLAYRGTNGVLQVGTPTADTHAATKKYVDDGLSAKADSSSLATVATTGSYNDLSNKPTIPAAQVNSDWNANSGVAQILNKPTLGTAAAADTTDFATAAQGALADTAVQKVTGNYKIYGTNSSGGQTSYNLASTVTANSIAYRSTGGVLSVGTPTADAHAATKKYVDDLIPTVNNSTITITQGGVTKGSFTLNQASGDTIALDAGGSGGSSNIPYGTSDSAADATEKTVSIPEITALNVGQIIIVQPSITSTVADSTLKLNNFAAYPMLYAGSAITTSTDSQVWRANTPTTWRFDGTNWVFLAHGYDFNTTYTSMNNISDNGQYTAGSGTYAITRYSLIMQKADTTWEKITATNKTYSTGTTKSVNTNGFRLNQIRYYSTTTILANGALSATNVVFSQAASVDMRYSTNCGGTTDWVAGDYIYLVGTMGVDGLFYLDTTTWWSKTLPNTNDGKLYIRLGLALADEGYTMSFFSDRPIFYHDGTSIREYNPAQSYHPEDNLTITENANQKIQAVAVIDQNTGIAKTWTGTQAEYDTIVTKDPETEYIITDDIGGPATVIAELAEGLNGKADVSTVAHVVTEFQEPTAGNNYTWYRKYADGWVEQGGDIATGTTWVNALTITMPVEMASVHYHAHIVNSWTNDADYANYMVYNKTTTTFMGDHTLSRSAEEYNRGTWYVCGKAA